MGRKRIGEILIEAGLLDDAGLRAGLAEQQRRGGAIGRVLVQMGLVSEEAVTHALSLQLNIPAVNLDNKQIPKEVLDLVPGEMAEEQEMIPFQVQGKFLDVAMADPTRPALIDELRIRTRLNIRPYIAGHRMVLRALARLYRRGPGTVELAVDPAVVARAGSLPTGARMLEITPDQGLRPAQPTRAQKTREMWAVTEPTLTPGTRSTSSDPVASFLGIDNSQDSDRLQKLETQLARDEAILRKLIGLLMEKGVLTREELLERLK